MGDRWGKCKDEKGALPTRSVDNSIVWLPELDRAASMRWWTYELKKGAIMAKRKKRSKVQSRTKLRRATSAKRSKARKAARAKTVTKAKPKRAPVKKAARKVKQPVAPVVETVVVDAFEQPVVVTEVEQTEIRKAS